MSKLKLWNRGVGARALLASLTGLGVVVASGVSYAKPGAHPPLLSTSDTRASSVALSYRQALGPLTARMISYNANFSSTGAILSAQFGAHVLQLQEVRGGNMLYGAGATGTAVWSIPLMPRYDNGVAEVALMLYAGGAPVAAVSGERNFLNVPIGVGVGVPLSPKPWVTFTPWFEAAPGVDLDTTIRSPDLSQFEPDENDIEGVLNGENPVLVSEQDVRDAISESVIVDVTFQAAMRAGLDITLRMSDSWSFNVNSYFTTLGTAFSGQSYFVLSGGLLFHWDDVVPSVLPASTRLKNESCDDIEARFRMCPPKQVQSVCEVPKATKSHVNALPQSVAPAPLAPVVVPAAPPPSELPTGTAPAPAPADGVDTAAPASTPAAVSFPPPPAETMPVNPVQAPVSPAASAKAPEPLPAPSSAPVAKPAPAAPPAEVPVQPTQPSPAVPKVQLPNTTAPY
jgi:hypothetical protein